MSFVRPATKRFEVSMNIVGARGLRDRLGFFSESVGESCVEWKLNSETESIESWTGQTPWAPKPGPNGVTIYSGPSQKVVLDLPDDDLFAPVLTHSTTNCVVFQQSSFVPDGSNTTHNINSRT